jgi:hypothetical protein
MSIDYVTEQPMTLAEAVNVLKALDCTIDQPDNRSVVARDPDGNYFHLTDDIGCYNSLCINASANEMTVYPTEVHDGTMRVLGTSYGVNDATMMADALGMLSEYDDEYHDIIGPGVPVPDEE